MFTRRGNIFVDCCIGTQWVAKAFSSIELDRLLVGWKMDNDRIPGAKLQLFLTFAKRLLSSTSTLEDIAKVQYTAM